VRILGIDPGLATTGIGLIEAESSTAIAHADWLTITTPPRTPLYERLLEIQRDLAAYIDANQPDLAVVEQLFFATNARTAIDVAQARGVILATVAQHAIPIMEPTPLQMKSCITGDGSADKKQVQDMIVRTLKLTETPQPDDAADALALALFGLYQHTFTLVR
jgi:crossover junction endodeoxyribonuclease RuvC